MYFLFSLSCTIELFTQRHQQHGISMATLETSPEIIISTHFKSSFEIIQSAGRGRINVSCHDKSCKKYIWSTILFKKNVKAENNQSSSCGRNWGNFVARTPWQRWTRSLWPLASQTCLSPPQHQSEISPSLKSHQVQTQLVKKCAGSWKQWILSWTRLFAATWETDRHVWKLIFKLIGNCADDKVLWKRGCRMFIFLQI